MQKDRLYIFKNKIDVQSLDLFLRKNEIRVPVIFRKIYNFSEIMEIRYFPQNHWFSRYATKLKMINICFYKLFAVVAKNEPGYENVYGHYLLRS